MKGRRRPGGARATRADSHPPITTARHLQNHGMPQRFAPNHVASQQQRRVSEPSPSCYGRMPYNRTSYQTTASSQYSTHIAHILQHHTARTSQYARTTLGVQHQKSNNSNITQYHIENHRCLPPDKLHINEGIQAPGTRHQKKQKHCFWEAHGRVESSAQERFDTPSRLLPPPPPPPNPHKQRLVVQRPLIDALLSFM